MKMDRRVLYSFLFCFISGFLISQLIQNGFVREQNSGKKPLNTVQVIFEEAVPAASGQDGKFKLVFNDKQAGTLVFMDKVSKPGYEVVNLKEIEQLKLTNTAQNAIDIIMAKTGAIDAAKKEYYKISDSALLVGFTKEKNLLRKQLREAQLNQTDYENKMEAMRKEYEAQREQLDKLSDKFARVNFDDVDHVYRMALDTFKAGKVDKAINLLESINLVDRADKRILERDRIIGAEKELVIQKAENEKGIQSDMQMLILLADMYMASFQTDKAEPVYDKMLLLDSTNWNVLEAASTFYYDNHRYNKSLTTYDLLLRNKEITELKKLSLYTYKGSVLLTVGRYKEAKVVYADLLEKRLLLLKENPGNLDFKFYLAIAWSSLGHHANLTEDTLKAREYFLKSLELNETLYKTKPENKEYATKLAYAYTFVGHNYRKCGKYLVTLEYYEKSNLLFSKIINSEKNKKMMIALSSGITSMADIYFGLDSLSKAGKYYQESLKLNETLLKEYPNDISIKQTCVTTFMNYGLLSIEKNNFEQGEEFLLKTLSLIQNLYDSFPNNKEFKKDLAVTNRELGNLYVKMKRIEDAIKHYLLAKKGYEELFAKFPEIVIFKKRIEYVNECLSKLTK